MHHPPYAQTAHVAGALYAYLGESSLGGTAHVMHAVLLHTMHMLMQLSCMLKAHVGQRAAMLLECIASTITVHAIQQTPAA